MIISQVESRPLLKGVFHLIATITYLLLTPLLIEKIPSGLELPLYLYLFALIAHFGVSAAFHFIDWPPNLIIYPRRLDHIMVFVKITATYFAMISTVIHDIHPSVIYMICFGSLFGIIVRLFFTDAPNHVIGIPYLIISWAAVLDPYILIAIYYRIPTGSILTFIAGLAYTIGAVIYILEYPQPCVRYMGYHDIFHLFTIIGSILLTLTIFEHAIPYYIEKQY
jgi:hemolysin III